MQSSASKWLRDDGKALGRSWGNCDESAEAVAPIGMYGVDRCLPQLPVKTAGTDFGQ